MNQSQYSFSCTHKLFVMNAFLIKTLKLLIYITIKTERLFGLSPSAFESKRSRGSAILSGLLKCAAVFTYPVVCAKVLIFLIDANSKTTVFARNLLLACNWVMLFVIYVNETTNLHRKYANILRLFEKLIKIQSPKQNLTFILKWMSKVIVIGTTLLATNFMKFTKRTKPEFSIGWARCSIVIILLPFVVFVLALNRIFMTNLVIKSYLMHIVDELQSGNDKSCRRIELSAIKYRIIHENFVAFSEANMVTLLTIVCFCIVNIVYEVFYRTVSMN